MIKKIFFILFLCLPTVGFSQEKTIKNLSIVPNSFKLNETVAFKIVTKSTFILLTKNVLETIVFKKAFDTTVGKNTIAFYKNNLTEGMHMNSKQNKKNIVSKRLVIQ